MQNIANASTVTRLDDQRPWKLVTHERPDTDAYLCLWAAARFVVKNDNFTIQFVRAGEQLTPEDMEGCRPLHMDTGLGEFDQHGKRLKRSSSFKLFCEAHGLTDDPALQPLIELSCATDNVEKIELTSIHYVLKGLAYHYKDPDSKEIDWMMAVTGAFMVLDIIYGQVNNRQGTEEEFKKLGRMYNLSNGVNLATIFHQPRLREAAFNAGADVVIWTEDRRGEWKGRFHVGIQVGRESTVKLAGVMAGLRIAEAARRGLKLEQTAGHNFLAVGTDKLFGGWFLHDSENLIVCGSRSHPLEAPEEFTTLGPQEILNAVRERLLKLAPRKPNN